MKPLHSICVLIAASTVSLGATAGGVTASVGSTAPSGEASLNLGSAMPAPVTATVGPATFTGGAFLTPSPSAYSDTSAAPPGSSLYWSIGISGVNGPSGSGSIVFSKPLTAFSFEWGSPDSYNTVSFFDAHGNSIGTFSGSTVEALDGGFALGDRGVTRYFSFSSPSDPFTKIVFTSSNNAFETANFGFIAAVPEASEVVWLGAGLTALLLLTVRARRQRLGLQQRNR